MRITKIVLIALSLSSSITLASEGGQTFKAMGSAPIKNPWTSQDYCADAKDVADRNADSVCESGRASRVSQYSTKIYGAPVCYAAAIYTCIE